MVDGKTACCGTFSDCASKSDVESLDALQVDVTYEEDAESQSKEAYNSACTTPDSKTKDEAFVEKRQTGIITRGTWLAYIESLGGKIIAALFFSVFSLTQAVFLVTIFFVGRWAEADDQDSPRWYGIVFGFTFATAFCAITRALLSFYLFLRASKNLHSKMLASVLRATVEFYDTNPLGRILNRFAADVGIVDEQLPLVMYEFGVGFIM